jgi:endonuclease/exonuclease/phosphatase family metal-dependent hydrolase
MSFNILREDLGGSGHLWANRKQAALKMIDSNNPTIIGLQECSWTIREDILKADSRRKAIGNSVNNEQSGYTTTSSNSIIYRSDIFEVVRSGQFWFSDTPDKVSNVFNASIPFEPKPRICTWARFRVINTGKEFYHFNIHLHNGSHANWLSDKYIADSRTKSLELLFSRIAAENTSGLPVIITGDHNEGDDSTNANSDLGSDVYRAYQNSGYTSARWLAADTDKERTLNSWGTSATSVLDHIYVNDPVSVNRFYVDRNAYEGVTYVSDHYPVFCEMTLK